MKYSESINSGIHYHIFWSNSSLDWKPFPTKEEAEMLAGQIKRQNESFTIVERDQDCERCKTSRGVGVDQTKCDSPGRRDTSA